MLCLTLMVFLLNGVLRNVVAVDCPGLPTNDNDFKITFRNLVASKAGEDSNDVTVTILSGPFFTCQVQGTEIGTYQKVSLIVTYNSNQGDTNAVGQFEMECIEIGGNRQWDSVSNSLINLVGVDYTTISLWTNCSDCVTNSPPNENHCQPCNSACNTGLMRCTGTGSDDCCVAFDNGVCSNDLTCTETNFVANEQNNYTCACGVVCGPGYMLNSSLCSCILTDTCLANTPCANNGTCVLGSSPDNYTCDCTGTNFMGVNCSVPEPPASSSSSAATTTTSSSVSPTPSPTNVVCNANCTTCDSMGCCSRCSSGFNRDGCGCVSIQPPTVCNIRGCGSCSSSDCCSQCEDGYEVDRESTCSCVISTSSSSVSPSPSDTNPQATGRSQRLNSNTLAGIAISVAVGILMLIVLVAVVGYVLYYYLAVAAIGHKTEASTLFGNGKVVPLNLQKSIDTERIYTEFDGDSKTAGHFSQLPKPV